MFSFFKKSDYYDTLRKISEDNNRENELIEELRSELQLDVFSIEREDGCTVLGYFLTKENGEKETNMWYLQISENVHTELVRAYMFHKNHTGENNDQQN